MRSQREYRLIPRLIVGLSLGLLPLVANEAAAQNTLDIEGQNCGVIAILCQATENETGDGRNGRDGRNGTDGDVEIVHDVGNAWEDNSCSSIIGHVTTGDEGGHTVTVAAGSGTAPVSVVPSVTDTGVDVVVPDCAAQAETTGGSGITINASGNDGDDATGGKGRDSDS